jgi:protein CpxP
MSSFSRTLAASAIVGVTLLAGPLSAMAADPAGSAAVQPAPSIVQPVPAGAGSDMSRETVEQRIDNLHASLNITPSEEKNWNGVTRVMRTNAMIGEKVMAEKSRRDPAHMTAVDELKVYEKLSRAHLDGLRKLTSSFEILYKSMPDAQKKVADEVFSNFGHDKSHSHS